MKKHLQYLSYLLRHKWWVFVAGMKLGIRPWNHPQIFWRLVKHDWTKFLPSEWLPYVTSFYSGCKWEDLPQQTREAFDIAWNHHQKRNDHHWQYWVLTNDDGTEELLIPSINAIVEMACDWAGAGRAIHGRWDAMDWYLQNQGKIKLNFTARILVVKALKDMGVVKRV
jgi:transposase